MPKSVAKESLSSTTKCRRSTRIAYKIKSMAKGKSAPTEERPSSTKKRGKLPYRKSAAKTRPASTKEHPSSTKESEKPSNSKKSVTKRQPESSDDEQSSEKQAVKKRRITKMDEIHDRASQMGLQRMQGFSIYITKILGELSPNLTISNSAIANINTYLNYVFERLARTSALFLLEKNEAFMTDKDIENAVVRVVNGELAKFCIAEGRRAVRKWNEE